MPSSTRPSSLCHTTRVLDACETMIAAGGPVPADSLAEASHTSVRALSESFDLILGVTPREFGQALRTGRARALLRSSSSVGLVLEGGGFTSLRSYCETSPPTLGMDRSEQLDPARGQQLRWTTISGHLGCIIVVASDRGLAAVRIGVSPRALLGEVAAAFPEASLNEDPVGLSDAATAIALLSQGRSARIHLSLDVHGTAFQWRVFEALRQIPSGEVRSYAEVAASIGAPRAVRAVGTACGANPLAIVIPCHRVVRSDGSLGGYRWGIDVKKQLLEAEASSLGVRPATRPTLR